MGKIEEIDSDDSQSEPELENVDDQGNRAEKKCRKAAQKMGFKPYTASKITRVTMKKKHILFLISQPDVYKMGDAYMVFGEAKLENMADFMKNASMMQQNPQKLAQNLQSMQAGSSAIAEEASKEIEETKETAAVATADVDEKDIALVLDQASCTREQAIEALQKNNNDIVEAIMSLS